MTQGSIAVSVHMITYNHAAFIRQAMESVLAQQTSHEWELVVGDDCSTDGTAEIVKEVAARYPRFVRVLHSDHNLGMHRNSQRTVAACRGRYLALLEGDDFWIDAAKIQKQADYLDRNPEVMLTGAGVLLRQESGNKIAGRWTAEAEAVRGLQEILRSNFLPNCTVMIRREAYFDHPTLASLALGDWPRWILAATKGRIHVSPEIMATYRLHSGGVWSHRSPADRKARVEEMFAVVRELHPRDPATVAAIADGLLHTQISLVNEMFERRMPADWLRGVFSLVRSTRSLRQIRDLAGLISPLRNYLLR
jgi:glycosyltransferase involved in cell wall biosynthesis